MKILLVSFYYYPEVGAAPSRMHNMAKGLKSRFASSLVECYSFKCVINNFKYWLFVNLVKLYGKLRGFYYIDSVNDTIRLMKEKGIELKV